MKNTDIKEILKESENQVNEWKSSWRKEYLEWICGYANAQGGNLYIGIDDDGNVIDLENTKRLLEDIPNSITNGLAITCDVNLKYHEKKPYIEIFTRKSSHLINYHGHYFYRTGSVKKELTGFELSSLLLKESGLTYDALISDVDPKKVTFKALKQRYLQKTDKKFDNKTDFESFGLKTPDGQLTNAGALFADGGKVYHSRIFATRWNGIDMNDKTQDALDSENFRDGLIQLLDFGKDFIKKNSRVGWRKAVGGRITLPDYPEKAIEEALINALIHRDYLQLGAEVHIDMYDDRVEITNPCGMIEGKPIQDRDPRRVPSKARNPVVADMFGRMNYMERRGSGFKKILDDYQAQDKYEDKYKPEFYSDTGDFRLTLWNLNYSEQVSSQAKEQVSEHVTTQVTEEALVDFCREAKSNAEIAKYFGYKDSGYFRRKFITPLIEANKLFMTVPDKPNSQDQKYYSLSE